MSIRAQPSPRLWSIVLAGGEGERVRPFVQRWLGCHKPKQYCAFVGDRSMLQHTVDRATQLAPPSRTVAIVAREHRREALAQLQGRQVGSILLQPVNRDTGAGIFLPLTYIRAHDRRATAGRRDAHARLRRRTERRKAMSIRAQPSPRLWSIVLAGGEGERVRPFVQRWLGCHKPKQYCAFVGDRSMLQHTVDRATQLAPPSRTVAIVAREHRREALAQLQGRQVGSILLQPVNRDTGAGIFLPLTYIRAHDRRATVVIYPSDHFVYPEDRFLEIVTLAVRSAEGLHDRVVLLGVQPDRLELDYGWIQPGQCLAISGNLPVRAVSRFVEKPTAAQADDALSKGAMWNTLVMAAKLDSLWQLGWHPLTTTITA